MLKSNGEIIGSNPPTVTTQRLKGMTIGNIPKFIDIGNSFTSDAISDDNLMLQLAFSPSYRYEASHGNHNRTHLAMDGKCPVKQRRLMQTGDDTWDILYPNHQEDDSVDYMFHQCSVWNHLEGNDANALSFILPVLHSATKVINSNLQNGTNDDVPFDFLISHMLGFDHRAHQFRLEHDMVGVSLEQTDAIIRIMMDFVDKENELNIKLNLKDAQEGKSAPPRKGTLLVVFGDHGMTEEGTHGGYAREETEAGLFMYSPRPLLGFQTPNNPSASFDVLKADCTAEAKTEKRIWQSRLEKARIIKTPDAPQASIEANSSYITQKQHCKGNNGKESNSPRFPVMQQINFVPTIATLMGSQFQWSTVLTMEQAVEIAQNGPNGQHEDEEGTLSTHFPNPQPDLHDEYTSLFNFSSKYMFKPELADDMIDLAKELKIVDSTKEYDVSRSNTPLASLPLDLSSLESSSFPSDTLLRSPSLVEKLNNRKLPASLVSEADINGFIDKMSDEEKMNQTTVLLLRVLEAQHQNLVQWRDFFSCVVELGNGFSAAVAKGQIVSQCEEAIDGIDEIITSLLSHPSTSVSPQHLPMLTSTQLHELAQVVNSTNTFLHETQRFVYANWETTDPTLMLEGLGLIISATLSILVILISFCSSQTDRPVSRRVKSTIGLVLCALTLSFIVFGLETLFHSQMRDVIPANSVIQTVYHHLGESHTVFGLTLLLLCLSSLLINKPFDNFISKAADFLRGSMTKINCTSIILFLVSLFFVISLLTSSFIICEQYMHFFFSIVLTVLVLVTSVFIFYTSRMKSRQEEVPITVSLRSLLRMTSKQKEATTTVPLSNAVLIFSLIPSVLTLVFISLQLHLTGFHPHNPPVVYPFSVLISSTIPRSLIWRLIFVVLNLATVTIAVAKQSGYIAASIVHRVCCADRHSSLCCEGRAGHPTITLLLIYPARHFAVLFIVIILLLVVKHEPSSFSSLYSLFVIVPLLFVMTEELQVGFCLALLTLAATQSITFFLHSYIASQSCRPPK
ncbi:putative GPI ethanolamine phosphate transferase 3 [Blattamonas nauphoetae]|uniref:GPI ethanolamine phosphate transferase 3 n=1 Tax=Blattamonas nauphoetae TaxID=2049346 RepID=A0ABQ9WM64_9EUKA|nr:putative GPI ethanolamine phosphate transferase 3 [Blattamonas nauphoetae]